MQMRRQIIVGGAMVALGAAFLAAIVAAKVFWIDYYRIPENGMSPGLPAGSWVFASKRPYRSASQVKRGDIVVFIHEQQGKKYNFIWRVVGLPGERVESLDESLAINGRPVGRQEIRKTDEAVVMRETIEGVSYEVAFGRRPAKMPPAVSMTVPADEFFVMGDNRFGALDSRYIGPIKLGSILGRKL